MKKTFQSIEDDVCKLDENEYLKRSKAGYSMGLKMQRVGLKLAGIALIVLLVAVFITALINYRWVTLLLTLNISSKYFFVYPIIFLAYSMLSIGISLALWGLHIAHVHWNYIGLGFAAVNTTGSRPINFKNKAVGNNTVTTNTKKTPSDNKKNKVETKQSEPDYYDIDCPYCDATVSVDKNFDYEGDFCCPFCNEKIDI